MRRRCNDSQPPAELLEFDGIALGYTTPAVWHAALDEWQAARRRWAATHGLSESELPASIGDEPWNPDAI
jgi:hypothetical protein